MCDEGDDKLRRVVTKKIASAEGERTGCHHVAICAPTSVQTQREFLPSSVHRHHSWHRLASAPVLALEMPIMKSEAFGIAPGNGAAPATFSAAEGRPHCCRAVARCWPISSRLGWLAPLVSEHRSVLYAFRHLDDCVRRLESGEVPTASEDSATRHPGCIWKLSSNCPTRFDGNGDWKVARTRGLSDPCQTQCPDTTRHRSAETRFSSADASANRIMWTTLFICPFDLVFCLCQPRPGQQHRVMQLPLQQFLRQSASASAARRTRSPRPVPV